MPNATRRRVLSGLGAAATLALGGCLGGGSSAVRYRLDARRVPGSLSEAFRWTPRGSFADADRALVARLVADGTLRTVGFAVAPVSQDRPLYVERDGRYYALTVEPAGTVKRERWILWFDLLDGDPGANAEVFTSSLGVGHPTDLEATYGLSPLDVRVVEDAVGEIPREFSYHDPEGDPPGRRGHVFVRRTAEQTDLLPEPPFTHVRFETGDGPRYARVIVERTTVELERYDYAVTRVAETSTAYAEHVRNQHLRASFDSDGLPEEQRRILEAITAGGGYEERAPISVALATILERLGLADQPTPEPKRVEFAEDAWFRYRDREYRAQLQLFG